MNIELIILASLLTVMIVWYIFETESTILALQRKIKVLEITLQLERLCSVSKAMDLDASNLKVGSIDSNNFEKLVFRKDEEK